MEHLPHHLKIEKEQLLGSIRIYEKLIAAIILCVEHLPPDPESIKRRKFLLGWRNQVHSKITDARIRISKIDGTSQRVMDF